MTKLYKELFYVPKDGKVNEKVMLTRMIVSIAVMIVCLAAMAITAYAYFSYNVISDSNVIKASEFETTVSISTDGNADEDDEVIVTEADKYTKIAVLHPDKTYSVTIEKTGTAGTGFCIISATDCSVEKYYTQQIGTDVNSSEAERNTITFTLTVSATTEVSLYSHWGTSSYYAGYGSDGDTVYIIDGAVINMEIGGSIAIEEDTTDGDNASMETTATEEESSPVITFPGGDEDATEDIEGTETLDTTAEVEITVPEESESPETEPIPSEEPMIEEPPEETTGPVTEEIE